MLFIMTSLAVAGDTFISEKCIATDNGCNFIKISNDLIEICHFHTGDPYSGGINCYKEDCAKYRSKSKCSTEGIVQRKNNKSVVGESTYLFSYERQDGYTDVVSILQEGNTNSGIISVLSYPHYGLESIKSGFIKKINATGECLTAAKALQPYVSEITECIYYTEMETHCDDFSNQECVNNIKAYCTENQYKKWSTIIASAKKKKCDFGTQFTLRGFNILQ